MTDMNLQRRNPNLRGRISRNSILAGKKGGKGRCDLSYYIHIEILLGLASFDGRRKDQGVVARRVTKGIGVSRLIRLKFYLNKDVKLLKRVFLSDFAPVSRHKRFTCCSKA